MLPFLTAIKPFDWQRLLLSEDAPTAYLLEVALRSFIAFILTILALRVSGKRGVRQLSLFEFGLLLLLGSAAGDVTFSPDVPLTYLLVVFGVVISLYTLSNYLIDRHPRLERLLEGEPELIVTDGELDVAALHAASLTTQELFSELRQQQVEHLGQVRRLYLEATGQVSVFFFEPEAERPGLPIWPDVYRYPLGETLPAAGAYACHHCAAVRELPAGPVPTCPRCQHRAWLPTCATPRVG